MNDKLNLRLLVPVLAGSALLTVGCSAERSAARQFCKTFEECEPSRFNDNYDSIGQCTKSVKLYAKAQNYDYKIDESAECAQASRMRDSCRAESLTCDFWDDYSTWYDDHGDDCDGEQEEFNDLCRDDDGYYSDYY